MAPRTSTKTKAAAEQAAATKPQDTPSGVQQEQAQSPQQGTPPANGQGTAETKGDSQGAQGDAPAEGLTADYIEATGFILNADGDVVDAAGRALPAVVAGDSGEAMVLQALAVACMPALVAADGSWSLAADGSFRLLESGEAVVPTPANQPTLTEFLSMKTPADQAPALAVVDEVAEMSQAAALIGSQAVADVLAERARQIAKGYTVEHDKRHRPEALAKAGISFAMLAADLPRPLYFWPFAETPNSQRSTREQLVRAAAMLLAAIEAHDARAEA